MDWIVILSMKAALYGNSPFSSGAQLTEHGPGISACIVAGLPCLFGGFQPWGHPKMASLEAKIPLKWMIWGVPQ